MRHYGLYPVRILNGSLAAKPEPSFLIAAGLSYFFFQFFSNEDQTFYTFKDPKLLPVSLF